MSSGQKPVLCYWDIRGLAQPIRLLLNYVGKEFEDKHMECGPAPTYDKSVWFNIKGTIGLDFPNLPYYIDGDIKVTQSNAILRHIARQHDMLGKTEKERVRVDILAEQAMDFRNGWVRVCYNPNFEQIKPEYLANLPKKLDEFSAFLGSHQFFAGGSEPTFADFIMYELLDQHRALCPEVITKYTNIAAFMDRVEALPKIAEYIKSDRFLKKPINNKMAVFK